MPRRPKPPSPLYDAYDKQVAAGLDALFCQGASEPLVDYLTVNRVVLGDGGFCLLAARVSPPEGDEAPLPERNGALAALLEAQLAGTAIYYMLPLRGLVICLIAMPQYRREQAAKAQRLALKLRESAEAAVARFRAETGCGVLAALCPVSFGVDSVRMAFRRTVDMLEYHRFFGMVQGVVTPPAEALRRTSQMPLALSNGASKAANLLSVQQYDGFQASVREQLLALRAAVPASLQQYKLFCFQLLDTLSCQLVQGGMGDGELLEASDLYWLVDEAPGFEGLCQEALDFLDRLTASWRDSRLRRARLLADSMRQYVLEHYDDPNLNVTALAARFGMTQPALSAYFKKRNGVSPQTYINRQRLQRAIELLQTTELTQPVIAERSGFGSLSTMHRIVKREMGMTPAQVRQLAAY